MLVPVIRAHMHSEQRTRCKSATEKLLQNCKASPLSVAIVKIYPKRRLILILSLPTWSRKQARVLLAASSALAALACTTQEHHRTTEHLDAVCIDT
jgi:hypothetical protein